MARSYLFVPGDSERKLTRAVDVAADALIVDLEDAVAESEAEKARKMTREFLESWGPLSRGRQCYVRINPMATPHALHDLTAIVGGRPDGILLPKPRRGTDVELLDRYLLCLEVREGLAEGAIKIIPTLTETPESLVAADTFLRSSTRTIGYSWGPVDLATALGATTNRMPDGSFDPTYTYARAMCLVTARADGVEPIDTISGNFRDLDSLARDCVAARRAGFAGKLAIHPDQVGVINETFMPSEDEIAHAQRVLAAFSAQGTGTVALDGEMLDMPHLLQAKSILERSKEQR